MLGWVLAACGAPPGATVTSPPPGVLDALDLRAAAGLPAGAVLRIGLPRVRIGEPEGMHWLDDRRLVVIEGDAAVLWDQPSGRLLRAQPFDRRTGADLEYRPWVLDRKRHRLAFVRGDQRVVDLSTGNLIWRAPLPPQLGLGPRPVLLSTDGKVVVAAAGPRALGVWSLESGALLRTLALSEGLTGPEYLRISLDEISPGSRFLVTHGRRRLWDLATGREILLPGTVAPRGAHPELSFGPSDPWLRVAVTGQGHVYFDPVAGKAVTVLGRLWHPERNQYHPLEGVYVDHQRQRIQVLEERSGRTLWQHPVTDDEKPHRLGRPAVRSILDRGELRVLDQAQANLPLRLPLPAGEQILDAAVADPLVLVRTNRRALVVHPDDRLAPLPRSVADVVFQVGLVTRVLAYDTDRSVLSAAVDSGTRLWRMPEGLPLETAVDSDDLDRHLRNRGLTWADPRSSRLPEWLRRWPWRGQQALLSPDGSVAAAIMDGRWLSLHRNPDGRRYWRRDLHARATGRPTETRVSGWSLDGRWLAAITQLETDEHVGSKQRILTVIRRRDGRPRQLWRASIRCGPAFSLQGSDLVVGAESDEVNHTEIRRYDAATGRLRSRHRLRGEGRAIAIDRGDRILAVVGDRRLHLALWQVGPDRPLQTLVDGLDTEVEFSPWRRYLRARHLDGTTFLWRVPFSR